MKQSFHILAIVFSVLMIFSGAAMAGTGTLDGDDTVVETDAAPAAYGDLEDVNVSPNVELAYNIAQTQFAITGFNTSGKIQYGLASNSSNIYFLDASEQTAVGAPSGTDSSSFSSYAVLGGGS